MTNPNRVATKWAAVHTIDLAWIEGLRKDFLTLMKNLPRVKNYQDGAKLRDGFRVYRKRFDQLFFDQFLNRDVKQAPDEGGWNKWLDGKIRTPAWNFSAELSNFPLNRPDKYVSEEAQYYRFKENMPKWEARMRRVAQAFWKEAKDSLDFWVKKQSGPVQVETPDDERIRLEGFTCIVRGYGTSKYAAGNLEAVREGLKRYRALAKARMPILLDRQLPLILDFQETLDKGGTYNHDGTITFYASSASEGPGWVAHALAHEMGHHLYRSHLGQAGREFWNLAIRQDFKDLDLQDLLDQWPGDAWAFQFTEAMGDRNPELALQVEALSHDPSLGGRGGNGLQSKEEFQTLLNSGIRTLKVPGSPITGYANKNPEEAFCEAVGLVTIKGPGALNPRVRGWLDVILDGQIKTAGLTVPPEPPRSAP